MLTRLKVTEYILRATRLRPLYRQYGSSILSASDVETLDTWAERLKDVPNQYYDFLSPHKIRDLHCTIPTRSSQKDFNSQLKKIKTGTPLNYGHSLIFTHSHTPENLLGPDQTETDLCPPPPFQRRMWAGGSFNWSAGNPLTLGRGIQATAKITSVEKKGFDQAVPLVFINQHITYRHDDDHPNNGPSLTETRVHVYLPSDMTAVQRSIRNVDGLPAPDFTFSWTPTPTTLFRYSALTFNAHSIHLDPLWSKEQEGYSERLVHGPLTALMLLEVLHYAKPEIHLASFIYRARNPVVVNQRQNIHISFSTPGGAILWATSDDGVVGMTGEVKFASSEQFP